MLIIDGPLIQAQGRIAIIACPLELIHLQYRLTGQQVCLGVGFPLRHVLNSLDAIALLAGSDESRSKHEFEIKIFLVFALDRGKYAYRFRWLSKPVALHEGDGVLGPGEPLGLGQRVRQTPVL